jgi:toxin ParE1/3/4
MDVPADPERPGAKTRSGLPAGILVYHLAARRERATGVKVKEPRHFLVYRVTRHAVQIIRVLHDSRDLARHLPTD